MFIKIQFFSLLLWHARGIKTLHSSMLLAADESIRKLPLKTPGPQKCHL